MRKRRDTYPPSHLAAYLDGIQTDKRVTDWEKRYRWDLCHASGLTSWICKELYPYANDSHIDTALKAIMKELG
jgi:hypothetical protein